MTPRGAGTEPPADGPMDDVDFALLADMQDLYQAMDPMPADLPERIRFSLSLRDLETEVARLAEEDLSAAAVRGAESSRAITFDSESLTIMIRIDANSDGTVQIDGWLAPPQRREIEMKTSADPLSVSSDEHGRFAFSRVPRGVAQLTVRPAGPKQSGAGPAVVTPALIL
jgi:hypothetical protein